MTRKAIKFSIRIKDEGFGIPEQHRDSVFQPFFRVDKSRSREYGGVGLGLSLVWEMATLRGGTIEVENSSSHGAVMLANPSLSLRGAGEVADWTLSAPQPRPKRHERRIVGEEPLPAKSGARMKYGRRP